MSYARFGPGSDVYVYEDVAGGFTCCGCLLTTSRVNVETRQEMVEHLLGHLAAGDHVQQTTLDRLRDEADGG